MQDVSSSSSLSRVRTKTTRRRCDAAMCHMGLLAAVVATVIDLRGIASAREEAMLEEQAGRKKRAVSFTKQKAEPVLTGYRAGGMWKSSSISSDDTQSGSDSYFNRSPLSEKHRTQSLGRKPWLKSASQPDVDGVYYKRIDSDSSVFNDGDVTARSTAPLLSNTINRNDRTRTGHGSPSSKSKSATKIALKSKSSDSLPRNSQSPDVAKKRTSAEAQAKDQRYSQRYSLPDIESQLPVNKIPPPPPPPNNREFSRSPKTGLLLDLNGRNARPRPRAQKNSSSTEESVTPTGLTPEAEHSRGFDNPGRDEVRPRGNSKTASATITDL